VTWDPADPRTAIAALRGTDALVNLCGAPVGPRPWTAGRRREIYSSRVTATRTLVAALAQLPADERPRVLVNASGTDGYTGVDAAPADERAATGHGLLADLGADWEAAAFEARAFGMRVLAMRTAFVLARDSALLRLLALPTRLGLGGPIGGGNQWFSWIHVDDLVAAYRLALADNRLDGVVNVTSPAPCRQRDLAQAMGKVLRRPSSFPMPGWLLRLALGEQSTLILGSRRVVPARLLAAGFEFEYRDLETALRNALDRPRGER
jgi:uncharacterized protein (TIGR01777 family)